MATLRLERHGNPIAWSASGTINEELSPKPYTITQLWVICRANLTTTSVTGYNDLYDRIITRLNLTGRGKTFFDFSNMRAAYHLSRFIGGPRVRRPLLPPDSLTGVDMHFAYCFHFGVAPWKVSPEGILVPNPGDLTAGIPPTTAGNLTLQGSFAANTAMGSNITTVDGDLDIYLVGVQDDGGDPPEAFLPQAFPVWSMQTPTLSATSSAFASSTDVPSGDYLHSIMVMLTNGSNAPRDDSVLNSFRLYNQKRHQEVFSYGGQAGVALDYKAAEIISQAWARDAAPTDNVTTAMDLIASGGTPGTITVNAGPSDSGLLWLPLDQFTRQSKSGHPLYAVNMRGVASGDLKAQYGIQDATGVTMDLVFRKYQLNPAHPANRGLV